MCMLCTLTLAADADTYSVWLKVSANKRTDVFNAAQITAGFA